MEEVIGWIATAIVVVSFTMKRMELLRAFSILGSLLFILYGHMIGSFPTVMVNVIIIVINGIGLIKTNIFKND